MADPKVVGSVSVTMYDNGTTGLDIDNVPYIQLYGVAALLHEQARMTHVMDHMAQQQQSGKGKLEVVRGMPSQPI